MNNRQKDILIVAIFAIFAGSIVNRDLSTDFLAILIALGCAIRMFHIMIKDADGGYGKY
jgi:hypothetical protein